MTTPDEHQAAIVVFRPCDRPEDDPAVLAGLALCRDHAETNGWRITTELVIPVCPAGTGHGRHRALAETHRDYLLTHIESLSVIVRQPDDEDLIGMGWWHLFRQADLGPAELVVMGPAGQIPASETTVWIQAGRRRAFSEQYGSRPDLTAETAASMRVDQRFEYDKLPVQHHFAKRSSLPGAGLVPADDPPEPGPVAERVGPLPHDGLFIRRNNAFGTRPTLGIAELIEQGVLIDQTRIRFDDFIAAQPDHLPAPGPGAAVAVSHGSTSVEGQFKAHDETTHLVEIALRAGVAAPGGPEAGEPLPVNFIFAVDISYSMAGAKLDDAMVAIRELHAELRDVDVLGIIVFDDQARTLLRATRKADLDPDEFAALVGGLRPGGGTDLNLGLSFALNEIERFAGPGTVNCVYLFSDGDPTSGERNWITIRANVAARLRGTCTLSCFGFGSDARIPELRALAGISGGHWTFVTQADDVVLTLADDLARRDSLAAINIQLRIDVPRDTAVWHVYGHDLITDPAGRRAVHAEAQAARARSRREYGVQNRPDLIGDEHGIRIFAPDLAFGETYWVVLEVQVPAAQAAAPFGTATVQYLDTVRRDNSSFEIDLSAAGAIPAETVLTHGVGLWTSEVTFYALDDLYENDRASARTRLTRHGMALEAAYATVPAAQFRDDRITLAKLVSLADNLGTMRSASDDGRFGYAAFTMSAFGRVRNGFLQPGPGR